MKTLKNVPVILFLLMFLNLSANDSIAQEKFSRNKAFSKNEISIAVGFIPLYGTIIEPQRMFGPIQVGYSRALVKWLNIGVNLSYNRYKGDTYGWALFWVYEYETDIRMLTLNVSFEFNYFHKPGVRLFSGFETGLLLTNWENYYPGSGKVKSGKGKGFAFQLNLFSCRIGFDKNFGFMADLGLGVRGLINVGFFAKF